MRRTRLEATVRAKRAKRQGMAGRLEQDPTMNDTAATIASGRPAGMRGGMLIAYAFRACAYWVAYIAANRAIMERSPAPAEYPRCDDPQNRSEESPLGAPRS